MQSLRNWFSEHKNFLIVILAVSLYTIFYRVLLIALNEQQEITDGILVETLGFLLVFIVTYWFMDRQRNQEQRTFERQVLQNQAEIRALLVGQQTNFQSTPPSIPESSLQSKPAQSLTVPFFAGTILITLLIIILRRTHKP